MIKICSLSSGSCGNSLYIEAGDSKILVDAGLSPKYINSCLKTLGSDIKSLSAILITHEHSDHIYGVRALAKLAPVPIYAHPITIDAAPDTFHAANLKVFPVQRFFNIGGFDIFAFPTSHDSKSSVGFCFYHGRQKICVATDLGIITTEIIDALANFDLLLLEANYSEKLLLNSNYPPFLKKRIQGKYGHLSNSDAALLLTNVASGRRQQVMLAHLSAEHNNPLLATNSISDQLKKSDIDSFDLSVAPRRKLSEIVTFA